MKGGKSVMKSTNVNNSKRLKFVTKPITENHERYFGCMGRVCAIGPSSCGCR